LILATLLTSLALACFAGNSLLARLALGAEPGAAASFTAIRLAAGAAVLAALSAGRLPARGWVPPLALLAYALPFSLAYVRIGASTGALILFGAVQLTMIAVGLARGERPRWTTWAGLALAAGGLAALLLPGATRPDPAGAALMALAGAAWGVYTLKGRTASEPVAANAQAFLWSSLAAVALAIPEAASALPTPRTALLAAVSGAVTSGLGYAVWYRALRGLGAVQAAILQLPTPVLTAFWAALLRGEAVTPRLVVAGTSVLLGVALATVPAARRPA
jgi:drug/metabolite transporter (DMT)-like permease